MIQDQALAVNGGGEVAVELAAKPNGKLSFRQAREAPCLSCKTSPCCTHLLLKKIKLETLLDVDYALYLLNFEGIILGLGPDATIRIYLHQPCGYLDVPSGLCTVHGTALQPGICKHYNAHSCQYRVNMTADNHPSQPLVDYNRFAWYADQLVFDDTRKLIETPSWRKVIDAFESMPLERRSPLRPAGPDPVREKWREIVISPKPTNGSAPVPLQASASPVSDPCLGCEAWCCKTLIFSREEPENANAIDFLRYCSGFPNVEIGVSDDGWALIVRTTCRHLDGGRCSVYGTDQRPLRCGYYNELDCHYRIHFGTPRPTELVRVNRDQFLTLVDCILFDDTGQIVTIPPVEEIRDRLEGAMRAGV